MEHWLAPGIPYGLATQDYQGWCRKSNLNPYSCVNDPSITEKQCMLSQDSYGNHH